MQFLVTEKTQCPAGKIGHCCYCQQEIGTPHKDDCVCIKKKVRVRLTIEYEVEVPSFWDKENIEFHRNGSSWCASNLLEELEKIEKEQGCLCPVAEFEYLSDGEGPFLKE